MHNGLDMERKLNRWTWVRVVSRTAKQQNRHAEERVVVSCIVIQHNMGCNSPHSTNAVKGCLIVLLLALAAPQAAQGASLARLWRLFRSSLGGSSLPAANGCSPQQVGSICRAPQSISAAGMPMRRLVDHPVSTRSSNNSTSTMYPLVDISQPGSVVQPLSPMVPPGWFVHAGAALTWQRRL